MISDDVVTETKHKKNETQLNDFCFTVANNMVISLTEFTFSRHFLSQNNLRLGYSVFLLVLLKRFGGIIIFDANKQELQKVKPLSFGIRWPVSASQSCLFF